MNQPIYGKKPIDAAADCCDAVSWSSFPDFNRKYSASTTSSPDPACSHMTQYSSQADLSEPVALSKYLQLVKTGHFWTTTRMFTFNHR